MTLLPDLVSPATLTWSLAPLGAVMDVLTTAIFVLFLISAVLVTLVVLAQEGKGGGLGGAFGGAAAETFGVKAGTVNRATAWLATAFLGLALLYTGFTAEGGRIRTATETVLPTGVEGGDEFPPGLFSTDEDGDAEGRGDDGAEGAAPGEGAPDGRDADQDGAAEGGADDAPPPGGLPPDDPPDAPPEDGDGAGDDRDDG